MATKHDDTTVEKLGLHSLEASPDSHRNRNWASFGFEGLDHCSFTFRGQDM